MRRCEVCGEWIPHPVPRDGGSIVCHECYGEKDELMRWSGGAESGEAADRQYHGGQFNRGEW